jgi:hypothetical protein
MIDGEGVPPDKTEWVDGDVTLHGHELINMFRHLVHMRFLSSGAYGT